MLHSYGGSPEMVREFTSIGGGAHGSVGARIFFSFSAALCRRSAAKCAARIRAVPEDRLLLESDLTEVAPMNEAMEDIVRVVGEARGWDAAQTVQQTWENMMEFYDRWQQR
jgi:TatD DNase family protein